jgi:mono/diheme cytochrome c family protein
MISLKNFSFVLFASAFLFSCIDQKTYDNIGIHEHPRPEFAPNMYHSKAYEPLTQVTDESAGNWVNSDDDGVGEYYNSNPLNPNKMNMREPVKGTIKRDKRGYLPYHFGKDSLDAASAVPSPIQSSEAVLADGKVLYGKYCQHCHGETGLGDGPVNDAFKGVANLTQDRLKAAPVGHFFHVITHGKGRMLSHASQVDQEERWKISLYIKEQLQQGQ